MKSLVLCACVLIIGSSNSTHSEVQLRSAAGPSVYDVDTCLDESNLTDDEFYNEHDLIIDVHTDPVNEEIRKKIGCFIACFLKTQNVIEGSIIKEEEVPAKLSWLFLNNKFKRIVPKCMEKASSITQECEKFSSIFVCSIRALDEEKNQEKHEKKVETEGVVTETEGAVTETEQAE